MHRERRAGGSSSGDSVLGGEDNGPASGNDGTAGSGSVLDDAGNAVEDAVDDVVDGTERMLDNGRLRTGTAQGRRG